MNVEKDDNGNLTESGFEELQEAELVAPLDSNLNDAPLAESAHRKENADTTAFEDLTLSESLSNDLNSSFEMVNFLSMLLIFVGQLPEQLE